MKWVKKFNTNLFKIYHKSNYGITVYTTYQLAIDNQILLGINDHIQIMDLYIHKQWKGRMRHIKITDESL